MKALCTTPDRNLELREIPTPENPAPGHLLVDIDSSAINHGDKTFLKNPSMIATSRTNDVWGASAAGRVVAVGAGAPASYLGKQVALYRSLRPTPETIGLWSQRAQIHHEACLILPDSVRARDYSGSLVNVITAYAFLEQAVAEGSRGIVATAGTSATGLALAVLAQRRGVPIIALVRSARARQELENRGVEYVLATSDADFDRTFAELAKRLETTAVFDGLGGEIVGRLAPLVPANTQFSFYGFLGGPIPISVPTVHFMMKNLVMKRFSNFESATVQDSKRLAAAFADLQDVIGDVRFQTKVGKEFRYDEIEAAMNYETAPGAKAVLVA